MKKRVVALGSADWHLHKFRDFDENGSRLQWAFKACRKIFDEAKHHLVPILFAGDLIHNPKEIENETLEKVIDLFDYCQVPFICISGNHDMSQKNSEKNISPTYLNSLKKAFPTKIQIANDTDFQTQKNVIIHGFSYHNDQEELVKRIKKLKEKVPKREGILNILLLHGDPSGCIQPNGTEVKSDFPKDMDKFFKPWDLVLWGHIHKPQKIGIKSIMLGSPIQQNFGDEGIEMGYWEIYSDASAKFISLNDQFPCFFTGTSDQIAQADSAGFVNPGKDYIRHIEDEAEQELIEGEFNVLTKTRKQLGRAYCKAKGIKSKSKREALLSILSQV